MILESELQNIPSLYIKQHTGSFLIGIFSDCPVGFIAAKPPGSVGGLDSCLLFVDETSSWYMAKLDCESRGAELADVSYKERVENINYVRAKYG